jgi:Leucine-rich repeat (LRR) protein
MSDQPKPGTRGSRLPVLAMLLLFFVADAGYSTAEFYGTYFKTVGLVEYGFLGILQAQAGILCILGGAVGRSWISSFLKTSALAIVSAFLFQWGMFYDSDEHLSEVAIVACMTSPLLFCGCIPFLALRGFCDWHLTRDTSEHNESYGLRIEDLLLAMIVIAGLLAIVQPVSGFASPNDPDEFSSTWMIAAACSMVASAVAVVPVSLIYFRVSTRRYRVAVLLLFAVLGLVASSAVQIGYQFLNGADLSSIFPGAIPTVPLMVYLGLSTGLFSVGLTVLHWSGFRWVTVATHSSPNKQIDPLVERSASVALDGSFRMKNRIAAAVIILSSIAIMASISHFNSERLKLAEIFGNLNSKFLLEGGYVRHQDHTPVSMRVPASALDSTIDLHRFRGLRSLSLSGNQLTESSLSAIHKMTSLTDLDISHTSFSDSVVEHLIQRRGYLEKLSLAGTKVTLTGVNKILSGRLVQLLDIGDLNLDDDAMKVLNVQKVKGLSLRGNPITDKSLSYLASLPYLDLSDTHCDGSELGLLTNVLTLKLDETSVDDAAIAQLFASNTVLTRLSLRNTQITDATLKTLAQQTQLVELELGDGETTVAGLETATFAPLNLLALNSRKFTGELFATWRPTVRRLDLSHSGVSDSDVHLLANILNLQELSLAHCDVTDASLKKLAELNLEKIDLTGTKVTATAAVELIPQATAVYVSPSQCSPEQLANANPRSSLLIGIDFKAKNY